MRDRTSRDNISLLLDADLEPEEREALEALLEADPELRRNYREFQETWSLLDRYPPIMASPILTRDLMTWARAEKAVETRGRLVRMTVGGAAAAALVLAVFLGLPSTRPSDTTTVSASAPTNGVMTEGYSMYMASLYDFEDF